MDHYNFYANMPSDFKDNYKAIFKPSSGFNDLRLFEHIKTDAHKPAPAPPVGTKPRNPYPYSHYEQSGLNTSKSLTQYG